MNMPALRAATRGNRCNGSPKLLWSFARAASSPPPIASSAPRTSFSKEAAGIRTCTPRRSPQKKRARAPRRRAREERKATHRPSPRPPNRRAPARANLPPRPRLLPAGRPRPVPPRPSPAPRPPRPRKSRELRPSAQFVRAPNQTGRRLRRCPRRRKPRARGVEPAVR